MRYLFYFLLVVLLFAGGYLLGVKLTQGNYEKTVMNNYSYVREIAELASLEVNGISNMKRTNVGDDELSFLGSLKKTLLEKTVTITVPYTAKYGVDLKDKNFKLSREDSVIMVHLPSPTLLSFELKLDQMQVNNKKGWLRGLDEEIYTNAQQKLYKEARAQLEDNAANIAQSEEKINALLQAYFTSVGFHSRCIFSADAVLHTQKN